MQNIQQSLFMRDDTFLGVCEALGEDLGFNANFLRATLGVLLLWNPVVIIGTYLGLGLVVFLSRVVFPNPRAAAAPQAEAVPPVGVAETASLQQPEEAELLAA